MRVWLGIRAGVLGLCIGSAGCAGPARAVKKSPGALLGTPHPLVIQAAAPDGSWVAVCQARKDSDGDGSVSIRLGDHGELFGDLSHLYLLSARQPLGEEIEELVAFDAGGRWLVFARNGALILRDTRAASDVRLEGASTTNAELARFVDLDAAGTQLLFARGEAPEERLVVRELASGTEREIDTGPGRLWRASFAGDGSWLRIATVPSDTNGNGHIDLPQARTSLARGPCTGPVASYSFMGFTGDHFEQRALRLRDGQIEARELLTAARDALVVQDGEALLWVSAGGDEHPLVPASCRGSILAVSPDEPAVLVACTALGKPPPLRIYDLEGAHELGVSQQPHDSIAPSHQRIAVLDDVLVDLAQRRAFPRMRTGEAAIHGSKVLETSPGDNHDLRVRDLANGRLQTFAVGSANQWRGEQFGRWAAVCEDTESLGCVPSRHREPVLLIDLEALRIVNRLPLWPIVVQPSGAALVPEGAQFGVLEGPLYWVAAPASP
jgi:hypothetical protein